MLPYHLLHARGSARTDTTIVRLERELLVLSLPIKIICEKVFGAIGNRNAIFEPQKGTKKKPTERCTRFMERRQSSTYLSRPGSLLAEVRQ